MGLDHAVALANGKGGVGKTSISANVAGTAALSGWSVLLVDLDPQGNLGNDLGYLAAGRSDAGQGLLQAVVGGVAPPVLHDVRPNLDVIPGGEATEELEAVLTTRQQRNRGAPRALQEALERVAGGYQLVIVDCPPSSGVLLEAALTAVHFLLIPTRCDGGSLDGLAKVARRFAEVRTTANPALELLGVVLFDFGVRDRATLARARERLETDLAGAAPVFSSFVRNSRLAPGDMRDLGLLAYEYEEAATRAPRWYEDPSARRFSRSAPGLAEDYQRLTAEILARFVDRRSAGFVAAAAS